MSSKLTPLIPVIPKYDFHRYDGQQSLLYAIGIHTSAIEGTFKL